VSHLKGRAADREKKELLIEACRRRKRTKRIPEKVLIESSPSSGHQKRTLRCTAMKKRETRSKNAGDEQKEAFTRACSYPLHRRKCTKKGDYVRKTNVGGEVHGRLVW